ncbi:MAG: hypothetical protein GEV07_24905 [Streptosporangiales bacterium]|nr:hypothetical protein [Streptosporangiales bacterium]
MDTPLATLHTLEGRLTLRFERLLAHPQEKVWRAITDPAEMLHWFPATVTTDLAIGAPMRFSFEGHNPDMDATGSETGEVLELDPPKVYAFCWAESVLRFELLPTAEGCRLIFTQTLSGTGTHGDLPSTARQAAGWDGCLGLLAARLDGTSAEATESWWQRAERYVAEFGLGDGTAEPAADGWVVRFERDLVQSPDQVWQLLTGGGELDPGAAPPVQLTHGYVQTGTITDVAAQRTVEYTWLHEGAPAGRVRFECPEQQPIGTRLVVTQTVPSHLAHLRATLLAAWQTHLELLFAALHGDVRCPWPADRTDELRDMYAARLENGQ